MDRQKLLEANSIVDRIDKAKKTLEDINLKFKQLSKDSTEKEFQEFFHQIVKSGYKGYFYSSICNFNNKILEYIDELEKELEAL